MLLSGVPASPLAAPTVLEIAGPLGRAQIPLSGRPAAWVDAINDRAAMTGVQALITDASTTLEDGERVDPNGDGYLLLFSVARGSGAQVRAGTDRPVAGLGFSVTRSHAHGRDDQDTEDGQGAGDSQRARDGQGVAAGDGAAARSAPLIQDMRPNPAT